MFGEGRLQRKGRRRDGVVVIMGLCLLGSVCLGNARGVMKVPDGCIPKKGTEPEPL